MRLWQLNNIFVTFWHITRLWRTDRQTDNLHSSCGINCATLRIQWTSTSPNQCYYFTLQNKMLAILLLHNMTSSPAVAETPRDASCLSAAIYSFDRIIFSSNCLDYENFCYIHNLDTLEASRTELCRSFSTSNLLNENSCLHYLLYPTSSGCSLFISVPEKIWTAYDTHL